MRLRLLVLAALVLLPTLAVAEDYDETELRLKTAGIEAPLRARIQAAIRRCVDYLQRIQRKDGSFRGDAGTTALCALALRHAGTSESTAAALRGARWLRSKAYRAARDATYTAGLTCMLLQALDATGRDRAYLKEIHGRLARGPIRSGGYWSYVSAGGDTSRGNLSTAQFAALGLWAAERAGAPVARKGWSAHLDRLLASQADDGSWAYYAPVDANGRRQDRGTYPTGTCMGLANLVLAQRALAEDLAADARRDARVRLARAAGRAALRRHVQWIFSAAALGFEGGGWHQGMYRMYALEKAAIFLDAESLGGLPWYREGALWLLSRQGTDGDWPVQPGGGPRSVRTTSHPWGAAFGLLFLLRSSASYHPVTPRPIEPPPATTPRSGDVPRPAAEPVLRAPPLDLAVRALKPLQEATRGARFRTLRPLLDAFRLTRRLYRQARREEGDFASPPHDTWARQAEATWLTLATRFRSVPSQDRRLAQVVAVEALEALGDAHARVGPHLMTCIAAQEVNSDFKGAYRFAWYGAAMESLRRLGPPGLLGWLQGRALSAEREHVVRTSTALTALAGLAGTMSGPARYASTRAILRRLDPLLRDGHPRRAERDLLQDVYACVSRLAGGRDVFAPGSPSAERLRAWWRAHRDPEDRVWQD